MTHCKCQPRPLLFVRPSRVSDGVHVVSLNVCSAPADRMSGPRRNTACEQTPSSLARKSTAFLLPLSLSVVLIKSPTHRSLARAQVAAARDTAGVPALARAAPRAAAPVPAIPAVPAPEPTEARAYTRSLFGST